MVNPTSVDVEALRAAVSTAESDAGWAETRWYETSADDGGRAAAQAAARDGAAVVLVVGGDGTVRIAAGELYPLGIPMAIVPGGTGNLFARNLSLPTNDLAASVAAAFSGTDRPIDVGLVTLRRPDGSEDEQPFLVMTGLGLDAHMAAHTNATLKKRVGWLAYSDPIARSVFGNRQIDFRFALDAGAMQDSRAHTVIVGNCGTLTAGMLLLPGAKPDDGLLDVVGLRPRAKGGWTSIGYGLASNRFMHRTWFGRLLARFLPASRTLRYAQFRRIRLEFAEPEEIQLDGDPFGQVTAATLGIAERSLTLRT